MRIAFDYYSALRRLGLDVDIVAPNVDLNGYAMVIIPCLPIVDPALAETLAAFTGPVIIGARSGSKTSDFAIPPDLPPGPLQALLPLKVTRVETLRSIGTDTACDWIERIETTIVAEEQHVYAAGARRYIACVPDKALLDRVIARAATEGGLTITALPEGLRIRRAGDKVFAFNYAAEAVMLPDGLVADFIIGSAALGPADVVVGNQTSSKV